MALRGKHGSFEGTGTGWKDEEVGGERGVGLGWLGEDELGDGTGVGWVLCFWK